MKDKTETAIRGSIEKWHNILHADGEDEGQANCPLCAMYWMTGCPGCPVYEKAGLSHCQNTPWAEWATHQDDEHDDKEGRKIHCPTCRELAQAEYDFLKDLLIDYLSTPAKKQLHLYCRYCGKLCEDSIHKQDMYYCTNCAKWHSANSWIEAEEKSRVKKKEEWEDITKKVKIDMGCGNDAIRICHKDKPIILHGTGWSSYDYDMKNTIELTFTINSNYKIENKKDTDNYFRILKRV